MKGYMLVILFIYSIIVFSCKNSQDAQRKSEKKSIYISQLKLHYVQIFLSKSFNDSYEVQQILKLDKSGFSEPILTEADLTLIDSLTTIDNEKLKIDSLDGVNRAEGSQGKRPLAFLVNLIQSKFLDSLANKRYKENKRTPFFY